MADPTSSEIDAFISRWKSSGGHERGAGHQFLLEFCTLLDLPHPDPPVEANELNTYTFGRKTKKRLTDIQEILNTLTALGKL